MIALWGCEAVSVKFITYPTLPLLTILQIIGASVPATHAVKDSKRKQSQMVMKPLSDAGHQDTDYLTGRPTKKAKKAVV